MRRLLTTLLALALLAALPGALAESAPLPALGCDEPGRGFSLDELRASLGVFDPDDLEGFLTCEQAYGDDASWLLRFYFEGVPEDAERRPDDSWMTGRGIASASAVEFGDHCDLICICLRGSAAEYGEQNGELRIYHKQDGLYCFQSAVPVPLTSVNDVAIRYVDWDGCVLMAVAQTWHGYNDGLAGVAVQLYRFGPGEATLELYAEANVAMPSMVVRKSMPADRLPQLQEFAQACYAGIAEDAAASYGLSDEDYSVFEPELEYPWREDGTVDERCFSAIDALNEVLRGARLAVSHTVRPAHEEDRGVHGEYYDLELGSGDLCWGCAYRGHTVELATRGKDGDYRYDGAGN